MSGETKQLIVKGAGWGALVIVLFLAYLLGKSAHNKATRNMMTRLDLTRQRYQSCETQRRMLTGQYKQKEEDELSLAQSDRAALRQENELLTQDNEELKAENDALEKEIDELKEQLDQKDFVTDDEIEALEETMALGNNSQALTDLLEDVQVSGDLQKDQLLETLVSELKKKTLAHTQCLQRVGELVATWGPRYPGGVDALKKAVKQRVAENFVADSVKGEEEEKPVAKKKKVVVEEDEKPAKKAADEEIVVVKKRKAVVEDEEPQVVKKTVKKVVQEEEEEVPKKKKKVVVEDEEPTEKVVVKKKKVVAEE